MLSDPVVVVVVAVEPVAEVALEVAAGVVVLDAWDGSAP